MPVCKLRADLERSIGQWRFLPQILRAILMESL
jgi:hypothetical protein